MLGQHSHIIEYCTYCSDRLYVLQECHTERVVDDDTEVYYNSGCMKVPVSQRQLNIRLVTPVYSNSAVTAGWLQSTRAQNIIIWLNLILSISKFLTTMVFSFGIVT